jgi:hypothetical protein
VEKTFVYMGSLVKECRKAVTLKFEREHKGIPFDTAEGILSKEVNPGAETRISTKPYVTDGKAGEIIITFSGATKDAKFKLYNGLFTLADQQSNLYLKTCLNVDKRTSQIVSFYCCRSRLSLGLTRNCLVSAY